MSIKRPKVIHGITRKLDDAEYNLKQGKQKKQQKQKNGSNPNIFVRKAGKGDERYGFVRFDLLPLNPNVAVSRASLRLFVNKVQTPGLIGLHVVTTPWDEESLNANPAPAYDPAFSTVEIFESDKNRYVAIDVTSVVQAWHNGTSPNFGIALTPDAAGIRLELDSKENTRTSHPMELEVVLEGPQGIAGQQGETGVAGIQGLQGEPGLQGEVGEQGVHGLGGPQGEQGPEGVQGEVGLQGLIGAPGPQGDQGQIGPIGLQGPVGPQGPPGDQGQIGAEDLLDGAVEFEKLAPRQIGPDVGVGGVAISGSRSRISHRLG